jgi:hypothetical protein
MSKAKESAAVATAVANNGAAKKKVKTLVQQFRSARVCGTPLIAIQTADQPATAARIFAQLQNEQKSPWLTWDCVRGFRYLNTAGQLAMAKAGISDPSSFLDLAGAAAAFESLEGVTSGDGYGTVIFIMNAQRHLERADQVQLIANLRDAYKTTRRSIVLLMPQQQLPIELQSDVIVLDEPLPTAEELEKIVVELATGAGCKIDAATIAKAVEAIQGLPAFPAEQVTAMSFTKSGLDTDALWERKRQQIEQTPSLSVSRDGIKFGDLGGLDSIKEYLAKLIKGRCRPNAVVWIDEIEKLLAGQGDTSGVSQDQLGALLSYMQDNAAMGVLLVGHPGSGKSAIAKATGNQAGIPTIRLDLGAAKGSLVGQSEAQLRTALKVITSVSNGSSLWIATCNNLDSLPPELRRRFKCGIFFFDLPSKEERDAIWDVHIARHNLQNAGPRPHDEGWTGAEIEQCCELAYRLDDTLAYAASFVVPISQSAADRVEGLRKRADGKWLSASHSGVYRQESDAQPMAVAAAAVGGARRLGTLED